METDPDSDLSTLRSQLSSDMADDQLDIESTLRSSQSKIKELRRELDAVDIGIDKLFTSYTALNRARSKVDQKVGLARERASMEKNDGEEGGDEEEGDDDKKRKRKDSSETEDPTTTSSRDRSKRSSSPIEVSEATLDAVSRILSQPLPQLEEGSRDDLEGGDMTEAASGGGGGGGRGGSSTSHQQQGNKKKIDLDKTEVKRVRTASPESGSGPGSGSGSGLGPVMKSIEGDEVVGDQEGDGQTLEREGEYGQDDFPDNEGEVNLRKDLQVNFVFLEQQFKRYEENMNKRLEMHKSDMNKRVETLDNDIYERIEKLERDAKSVEKLENWMGSGWNEWVGETITYGGNDTDDEDEEDSEDEDSEENEEDSNNDDDDDDDDNDDDNYNGNLPSPPDDHTLTNSANH